MVGLPPLNIDFAALLPEFNTFRLQAGAGAEPMLQAAAGWEAWAIALETQALELAASMSALSGAWSGMASERAVAATMPMVAWLQTAALQAQKRAMQAAAQAASYTAAATATPQLPEIAENHITNFVLNATNFLGVNTVPIAFNEADYIRMWDLAAATMYAYLAETTTNVMFEPILPAKPVVIPGVAEVAAGAALGQLAANAPGAVYRDAVFARATAQGLAESVGLKAGEAVGAGSQAATLGEGQANHAQNARPSEQNELTQGPQQFMQSGMQMVTQIGSQAGQIPQMLQSPMQQLTQPLQQVTSMVSQFGSGMGSGDHGMQQLGLMGTSPFSNHPLAGGSGASTGAGLVRAASLPGMGGSAPRTPLMASLIDKAGPVSPAAVEPVGAAAGASATGGTAPVGAGSGGSGAMGPTGQRGKSGGTKGGLKAPSPLTQDLGEDDGDDW